MAQELIGAIEAGGTKMVCATGYADGTIVERMSIPTESPDATVAAMAEYFGGKSITALGLAAFGPTVVNPHAANYGHILDTPKLAWKDFDFLGAMRAALGVPVGYDTDVNAACLGEVVFGSAHGLDAVVYITVGTGIGAGVYLDGRLLHGMLHPEAGHISVTRRAGDVLESVCPYHGSCLEGLASGPAVVARYDVAQASDLAEDEEFLELESDYLAQGIATYVLTYSPQRVVLAGGVPDHVPGLLPRVRVKVLERLGGYLSTPELADMDSYLVPSSLDGNQGILGAIELGRRARR